MRNKIREQLARLRLRGIDAALDAELDRAEAEGAPASEVLWRLFAAQEAHRREKSLAYRLTQAKLPWHWTLDSFPFDRQPGVDRGQIRALAGLDFLRRNENILLIGPPGTGKTGIAIALLREACLNGHAGRFYNAQLLLDELYASLADRSTPKLLAQLARFQPMPVPEHAQTAAQVMDDPALPGQASAEMPAQGQRLLGHEARLRHRAFDGIDQQQHAIDHRQRTLHLTTEVGVAGGIDDVDVHPLVLHSSVLGQNGDAALALQIV